MLIKRGGCRMSDTCPSKQLYFPSRHKGLQVPRPLAMRYSSEPYGKSPDNMTWSFGQIKTRFLQVGEDTCFAILVGGFNPFANISQIGNLPQIGMKIKNIRNHHLVSYTPVPSPCPLLGGPNQKMSRLPFLRRFVWLINCPSCGGEMVFEKFPGNPERGPYGWYVAESTTHPKVSSCQKLCLLNKKGSLFFFRNTLDNTRCDSLGMFGDKKEQLLYPFHKTIYFWSEKMHSFFKVWPHGWSPNKRRSPWLSPWKGHSKRGSQLDKLGSQISKQKQASLVGGFSPSEKY